MIDNKKLVFKYATFKSVYNLASFISRKTKDKIKLFDNNIDININTLIDVVLECVGDEDSLNYIFDLSKDCIFNNEKIDNNFFEDVDNRKYFFEIVKTIIVENIKVFTVGQKIM